MAKPSLFIFLFIALFSFRSCLAATRICKVIFGAPSWPNQSAWDQLNRTLSGALLRPAPPAQPCYATSGNSSESSCGHVTEAWFSSSFHADDPVSVAWPNWQDDACLPTSLSGAKGNCSLTAFPTYVVNASSALQIAESIKFAASKEIRIVVKGGAHDLLGRSTVPLALSIWTRKLRGLHYHEAFSICMSPSVTHAAITTAAGHNMGEIYQRAAEHSMTLVGGGDPNVGLGGYLTGGGHSPLGTKYGMAVDNVLELSMITAEGMIIRANACQNEDLFWSMRGGGGATFGILLNATLRAYPMPSVSFSKFDFNSTRAEALENNNTAFYAAAAQVIANLPALASVGLSGYFSLMPLNEGNIAHSQMNFAFLMFSPSTRLGYVHDVLDPVMTRLNRTAGLTTSIVSRDLSIFFDFQSKLLVAGSAGTNRISVSRLWDVAAVKNETHVAQTLSLFSERFLQGSFVSGQGVQSKSENDSALHPAWRRTVVHMLGTVTYPLGGTNEERYVAFRSADKLQAALTAAAPHMGCYLNEAYVSQPDYHTAFWGNHYTRLIDIKRRVDPLGVFWCPVCVGAEDWSLQSDGTVCKL